MKNLPQFAIEKTVKADSNSLKHLVSKEITRANDTLGARVRITIGKQKK